MAVRRRPEPVVDVDVDAPPPNWQARWVHALRIGTEHVSGPENRMQSHRQVFGAGDVDAALAWVRERWAAKPPEVRRRWWADDGGRPATAPGTAECPEHRSAVAYCPQDCRTMRRLQRAFDTSHRHYWTKEAQ